MSKDSSSSSGGAGFCTLLAVAFIVLKLCEVIEWSWWWVLSTIWIPITVVAVFLFAVVGVGIVKEMLK